MSKANSGYIFVRKHTERGQKGQKGKDPLRMQRFFTKVDKNSAKPAFCYVRRAEKLAEELEAMEKKRQYGQINPDRRIKFESDYRERKERVEQVMESFETARKIIDENPDEWMKIRKELGEEISERMPTRKDAKNKKVSAMAVLKEDKENGLQEKKLQYQIISKALQAAGYEAESNISFLEREK